ncbi:MAG: adenylate kinase [Armatimonadota bacterium]
MVDFRRLSHATNYCDRHRRFREDDPGAAAFSQYLGIPHVELDALNWSPNWIEAPIDTLRDGVTRAISGDAWVVDGNYSKVRDIVWPRADTVVWLDYSLPVILWQLARRTFRRVVTREELWSGNRERLRTQFSRDSLFLWALKTYGRRQQDYPLLVQRAEYAHLTLVRLRSPQTTQTWLSSLRTRSTA